MADPLIENDLEFMTPESSRAASPSSESKEVALKNVDTSLKRSSLHGSTSNFQDELLLGVGEVPRVADDSWNSMDSEPASGCDSSAVPLSFLVGDDKVSTRTGQCNLPKSSPM